MKPKLKRFATKGKDPLRIFLTGVMMFPARRPRNLVSPSPNVLEVRALLSRRPSLLFAPFCTTLGDFPGTSMVFNATIKINSPNCCKCSNIVTMVVFLKRTAKTVHARSRTSRPSSAVEASLASGLISAITKGAFLLLLKYNF